MSISNASVYIFSLSLHSFPVSLAADDLHHRKNLLRLLFFTIHNCKLLFIYRSQTNIQYIINKEKKEKGRRRSYYYRSLKHIFSISLYRSIYFFSYQSKKLEISACDNGNDAIYSYIGS